MRVHIDMQGDKMERAIGNGQRSRQMDSMRPVYNRGGVVVIRLDRGELTQERKCLVESGWQEMDETSWRGYDWIIRLRMQ